MTEPQFDLLLKQRGLTFFWNEPNKIWWVRQNLPNGRITRSSPAGARNRDEAEAAATKLIGRQFKYPISEQQAS